MLTKPTYNLTSSTYDANNNIPEVATRSDSNPNPSGYNEKRRKDFRPWMSVQFVTATEPMVSETKSGKKRVTIVGYISYDKKNKKKSYGVRVTAVGKAAEKMTTFGVKNAVYARGPVTIGNAYVDNNGEAKTGLDIFVHDPKHVGKTRIDFSVDQRPFMTLKGFVQGAKEDAVPNAYYLDSGSMVANFSIPINYLLNDEEKTDWYRVCAFGDTAEKILEQVQRGMRVSARGKLTLDAYVASDGTPRGTAELMVFTPEHINELTNNAYEETVEAAW